MHQVTRFSILFGALFLSACQTVPSEQAQPERNNKAMPTLSAEQQKNSKTKTQPKTTVVDEVVPLSPAVSNLLAQAEKQQQAASKSGNYNAAIATLERAIRIAPRYPESYYRLAKVRFQQGNYAQALSLAQKAISLGASGKLKQQSLSLIALSDK